ncbi:LysM peptidoglycan-binding domain-containing protein [uncultured Acetatifactor sp.]|uniref:LysM peptidoglycan-binding domain-containing protein n=1 Tax=uncultured Acetatifactor sp. TaxID=1671927 RepID=UPI00262CC5BE|nr:LysM peptidoglycan-binding domain-containing protein [uncultured Acetatifactor sp.]
MSSSCQMYLAQQNTRFRFPVLPEKVVVSYGSDNDRVKVCGVGEVTVIQDSDAAVISFSRFFPEHYFSGCDYENIPNPLDAVNTILALKNSKRPVRFTITGGMNISMYVTIERFETEEQGGDPGTIHYAITLKEYREVSVRQVKVQVSAKKATISAPVSRTDTAPSGGQTYTVVKGDCLWNISKKFYGSGAKYTIIYDANKSVIGGNPNLIYPKQVLTIPAA